MSDTLARALAYPRDVVAGRVVASRYLRLACERSLALHAGPGEWEFREDLAAYALEFFEQTLTHSKGEYEGRKFTLLDWQAHIVAEIFGWVRRGTSIRKHRKLYLIAGKGAGKSPLMAGLALYCLLADGEARGECFLIAASRDQSAVAFRYVVGMVQRSPELQERLGEVLGGENAYRYTDSESHSFLARIARRPGGAGLSGPTPNFVGVDELHEWSDRDSLDILEYGSKTRRNPLEAIMTNAGSTMLSVCGQEQEAMERLLDGEVEDEGTLAYLYQVDPDDDPIEDESVWLKSQPSLPAAPGWDFLRRKVEESRGRAGLRAQCERLLFARWTDAEEPWLAPEVWTPCEASSLSDAEERSEVPCWLGLDLAIRTDFAALAAVWDFGTSRGYEADVWVWTPADHLMQRSQEDMARYPEWVRCGDLLTCPGRIIDYDPIVAKVMELEVANAVVGLAYDPWRMQVFRQRAEKLGLVLSEEHRRGRSAGLWLCPHRQGYYPGAKVETAWGTPFRLWMSQSLDAAEEAILKGRLRVRASLALRSAVSGVVITRDRMGDNRAMDKAKAGRRKTDAAVALVMALGAAAAWRVASRKTYSGDLRRLVL